MVYSVACSVRQPGASAITNDSSSSDIPARLTTALGPQYEVRRLLGRGGFAEVYEVWDRTLDRRLAVKVLRPDVAWSAGMLARFREEARAVAKLTHQNILPIHFVGEAEGLLYYVMPYVEGRTLGDVIRSQGALQPDRALGIIRPVLEALEHAHRHGFLHRDIKPDNVMLDEQTGRVLLMDFGIVKRVDAEGGLTQTGFVVGTPHYMSPEQALGQADLDARSDLYSLGAMLFQMVTGTPPFEGDTSQEIVAKHLSEPPPVPVARNAELPRWLSDVIVRCLAKRPSDRYESAAAVMDALVSGPDSGMAQAVSAADVARRLEVQATTPIATPSAADRPQPEHQPTRSGAWRRSLAVAAVVLFGAGAAGFLLLRPSTLLVENALVVPIRITIGQTEHSIPPGSELRIRIPRRQAVTAPWSALRPETPGGVPMGVELQGAFVVERSRGTVRRVATHRAGGRAFFAPLVSNGSDMAVSITVNAGLVAEQDCACRLPPGIQDAVIGYYPLFSNSSVRVNGAGGRSLVIQEIAARVAPVTGTVPVEVGELR